MSSVIKKDAFEELEQKMVENQDLSRVVEGLKEDVEAEIGGEKTISQYNLERELDSRARTIESAFSSALAQADNVLGEKSDLDDRTSEDEFKDYMDRDAVDAEDMQNALDIIEQYQQLVSRLVLVLKIYRDDRQLLRSGIDIQQTRANESQVMEMVKELIESQNDALEAQQTEFRSMTQDMADEFSNRVQRVVEDNSGVSEEEKELAEELRDAAEELKEARRSSAVSVSGASTGSENRSTAEVTKDVSSSSGSSDPNTSSTDDSKYSNLGDKQKKVVKLVEENPEKDLEWYAGELDYKPQVLKMFRTKIQSKDGFEDFSYE